MNTKALLVREFEIRVFNESYERIYKCLSMIEDQYLWKQIHPTIPSIGNLILHLCGNSRQWILSGLGGREDNRNRDQEFIIQTNIKKSELVFLLENMKVNLKYTLNDLTEKDMNEKYIIQGFTVTGYSAITHVLEHFSYHTGQITLITKFLTSKETGYYTGQDLNQPNN
jgi:uncharacterized damage-inducible protein DinB